MNEKCTKNVFPNCAAIKKKNQWFQSILLSKKPYTLGELDNMLPYQSKMFLFSLI
jgi:hypothetical protein